MNKKFKLSVLGLILTSNIGLLSTGYANNAPNNNVPNNNPTVLTEAEKKKLEEKKKAEEAKKKAAELNKKVNTTNLNLITVKDTIIKVGSINNNVKGFSILKEQLVNDVQDIVRYDHDITLEQDRRFGSTSFSIRGVNDNRVAISIDGIAQAETTAPHVGFFTTGFNFDKYYNTRNSIEVETIGKVKISKGADSINSGSGALGGSVNYDTKNPQDFVSKNKKHYGSFKTGYNSSNSQRYTSLTGASTYDKLDLLALLTYRKGKEINNFAKKTSGTDQAFINKSDNSSLSLLLKANFKIDNNNKISYAYDYLEQNNETPKDNYTEDDTTKRINHLFTFEGNNSNPLWDSVKVKFSIQNIESTASSKTSCKSSFRCKETVETNGIGWKDGKIVDANGDSNFKLTKNLTDKIPPDGSWHIVHIIQRHYYIYTGNNKKSNARFLRYFVPEQEVANNRDVNNAYYKHNAESAKASRRQYWYDCNLWDCNNITVYTEKFRKEDLFPNPDLTRLDEEEYKERNKTTPFKQVDKLYDVEAKKGTPVATKKINGKTYTAFTDGDKHSFTLIPTIPAYKSINSEDRILTTDSKQLSIDFTKALQITDNIESDLYYGAIFSTSTKTMAHKHRRYIDRSQPLQPWLEVELDVGETCNTLLGAKGENLYLCPYESDNGILATTGKDTTNEHKVILVPIEKNNSAIYIKNNYYFNEQITIDAGIRFDKISYYPKFNDFIDNTSVAAELDKIELEINELNIDLPKLNQQRHIVGKSYAINGSYNFLNGILLSAKYGRAFRAPTTDELYFTNFQRSKASVLVPAKHLRPEIANNFELSLTFANEFAFAQLNSFITKYDDFINHKLVGKFEYRLYATSNEATDKYVYKMSNAKNAKVSGIEFKSRLALGKLPIRHFEVLQGLEAGYSFSSQKGFVEGKPLNTINPPSSTFDVSYVSADKKLKLNLYVKHVQSKKSKYIHRPEEDSANDPMLVPTIDTLRNTPYTTVDLTTQIKPLKGLTIRAGIYNLFNKRYITWNAGNSIKNISKGTVDNDEISNVATAPRRNYKVSFEYEF